LNNSQEKEIRSFRSSPGKKLLKNISKGESNKDSNLISKAESSQKINRLISNEEKV